MRATVLPLVLCFALTSLWLVVKAQAVPVTVPVVNADFESATGNGQDIAGWTSSANTNTTKLAYVEDTNKAHGGKYHGTHWNGGGAFEVSTAQTIANLKPGYYSLAAWAFKTDDKHLAEMTAADFDAAGATRSAPILPGSWHLTQLSLIRVTSGKLTIGFHTKAGADQGTFFDDVSVVYLGTESAAPPTPTEFKAATVGPDALTLSWSLRSDWADKLVLERASDAGFTRDLTITELPPASTGYTYDPLPFKTAYYFRLRASGPAGVGALTPTLSVTTLPRPAPSAPTGLISRGNSSTTINVMWNDGGRGYQDAYKVEISADAAFRTKYQTLTLPPKERMASFTNLSPATDYNVRLTSLNDVGASAPVLLHTFTSAPAHAGTNLLVNGGFELGDKNAGAGYNQTTTFPGWQIHNWRWGYDAIVDGKGTEGARYFRIESTGVLNTNPPDRPKVIPGRTYELNFDCAKYRDNAPGSWAGPRYAIEFFDAAGKLVGHCDAPSAQCTGIYPWETLVFSAKAPAAAATAGILLNASNGWPNEDALAVTLDNFRLVEVAPAHAYVFCRHAPSLLEPGKTANIGVSYAANAESEISVRLMRGATRYPDVRRHVGIGTGSVSLDYPVPASLSAGKDHTWEFRIVKPGVSAPLARSIQERAFCDQTVHPGTPDAAGSLIAADSPDLVYIGRWDLSTPAEPVQYWGGSQIRVRFTGTSIAAHLRGDNIEYRAIIDSNRVDGNDPGMVKFVANGNQWATIASGLSKGIHTLTLARESEVGGDPNGTTFSGFRLDAGAGTLRAEPAQNRRIEFFGDSITSGGSAGEAKSPTADVNKESDWYGSIYRNYAMTTARELGADGREESKGAAGIQGSWVTGTWGALNWWDKVNYNIWAKDLTQLKKNDFSKWQPQAVVIALGQNDQFINRDWVGSMRVFVNDLQRVYPNAQVFITNTTMTGSYNFWDRACISLVNEYHNVHYRTVPGHGNGHPSYPYHQQMALGGSDMVGMADWISSVMEPLRWGQAAVATAGGVK